MSSRSIVQKTRRAVEAWRRTSQPQDEHPRAHLTIVRQAGHAPLLTLVRDDQHRKEERGEQS